MAYYEPLETTDKERRAMRSQRYVRLTGVANGAELVMQTLKGEDHIVVPVIMLVGDIVVWPMNRPAPEFVPASELELASVSWNGRPVLPDHPSGGASSANTPDILESMEFGQVFNARFEDGKLKGEAWLNVARAEELGGDAQKVVDRVNDGEMVEVSVGAWIQAEEKEGTWNGQEYEAIWRDIKSDHLAMLPEGTAGACSIEDGCGAPRVNQDGRQEDLMEKTQKLRPLEMFKKIWAMLEGRSNQADGEQSDIELRKALYDALRAVEPGFYDIDVVYSKSKEVIYLTYPEDTILWFRRTYKVAKDGAINLADDAEQVEMKTVFEPVAAAEGESTDDPVEPVEKSVAVAAASCPCNNPEGEPKMDEKVRELIEGLIACEHSPFTEEDSEKLAGFSEEHLAAMAESFAETVEPDPDPEPKPEPIVEDEPDPKEKTDEEWLAEAPESLRRLVSRSQAEETTRRTSLVGAIAKATTEWSEESLKSKPTEDLESIARALKLDQPKPDFSAQLVEQPQASDIVPSPKPYSLALEARRNAN